MEFKRKETFISREIAEEQFQMWLDAYDIDAYSYKENNPEEFKRLENTYSIMISRIERGLITVQDDGEGGVNIIQNLSKPIGADKQIIYKHLTSRHLIARDRFEEHETRKNALLAAMSEKPSVIFESMKAGVDSKTADMVYTFFLLDY